MKNQEKLQSEDSLININSELNTFIATGDTSSLIKYLMTHYQYAEEIGQRIYLEQNCIIKDCDVMRNFLQQYIKEVELVSFVEETDINNFYDFIVDKVINGKVDARLLNKVPSISIAKYLSEHCSDKPNSELNEIVKNGHLDVIKYLVNHK